MCCPDVPPLSLLSPSRCTLPAASEGRSFRSAAHRTHEYQTLIPDVVMVSTFIG